MNNLVLSTLTKAVRNKHTSIAAFVYAGLKIAAIWLPQYKDQLSATEGIAVAYGLFMAGDASQSQTPANTPPPPKP